MRKEEPEKGDRNELLTYELVQLNGRSQAANTYIVHIRTCEQRQSDVDGCLAVRTSEPKGTQAVVRSSGGVGDTGASKEARIRNACGLHAELTSKPLIRKGNPIVCARSTSNNIFQTIPKSFLSKSIHPYVQHIPAYADVSCACAHGCTHTP